MEEEKKEIKKQDTNATEKVEKKETKPVEKKAVDKKDTTGVKKEETKKETKKQKTSKNDQKKSNIGVIVGIIVIIIVLVAMLAYMFSKKDSPRQTVETMLSDLKSGNYSQSILAGMLQEEEFDQETQKLLFDKLDWKILNVSEEGDKATVEIEITNKDFKTIIENYMQRIIKVAFSGENPSEEEITNYLVEELKNDEVQNVTSNQVIVLEKKDGKWEVTEENNFVNIFLPGFNEAISSFQ